ncbi:acetate/propionate family kinase [Halomonas sp. MCCC 1A17488]|uniref:acetate/propionate family kinase n=1 Tax=unclassified Halomonas TaxID=2609666 RepID=UPI0018D2155C|nr:MULTISPECIES: acetate/propionate family kinase [unclassified Halomonas]MCE8015553.1 acetate/propionate family kinase [Halomonas sp. MCCC 1A17488]MCG3238886.1 acetate/propionate family kinase [Halomonas sp. MCCC 1A17488]QPP51153.1 acetate/propionate family kinase [Halomonas sp. SS10-MC5]
MSGEILVVNSGSSSLKFALFEAVPAETPIGLRLRCRGQFAGLGDQARVELGAGFDEPPSDANTAALCNVPPMLGHPGALARLLEWVEANPALGDLRAVGHRIVHGGAKYRDPLRLDESNLGELQELVTLAPLHQPHGLAAVRALADLRPALPQVACFDTAFHAGQPAVAQSFPLPRRYRQQGVIRYGFHGLSFDYVSRVLGEQELPQHRQAASSGRVIIAHLGNGASLCALRDGRSVAATTGFTALEGLMMGTRSGSLDPGLVLHLILQEGMSAEAVQRMLYRESGLLGVSGISGDMRELLASRAPAAAEAIELYVYRIVREIGSLAAALGGLDHLVFTAGIGEHAAPVRAAVAKGCEWLGARLDTEANAVHATDIAAPDSRLGLWVIPTDEERMIAWYTAGVMLR